MFLTNSEIYELTGYKQTAAQVKWLRDNGVKFLIGADDKPRVLKAHIENMMGIMEKPIPFKKKSSANLQALAEWQGTA